MISRSTAKSQTTDGSHDDGFADGVQVEIHRPDTDDDRRSDPLEGYNAARRILLRAVRRRSWAESALTTRSDRICGGVRKRESNSERRKKDRKEGRKGKNTSRENTGRSEDDVMTLFRNNL